MMDEMCDAGYVVSMTLRISQNSVLCETDAAIINQRVEMKA